MEGGTPPLLPEEVTRREGAEEALETRTAGPVLLTEDRPPPPPPLPYADVQSYGSVVVDDTGDVPLARVPFITWSAIPV